MLIEICALAAGAKARPASNAAVESNVVSLRICDPFEVSTIPELAWDAVCSREEEPSNSSNHKDFETVPKGPHNDGSALRSILTDFTVVFAIAEV